MSRSNYNNKVEIPLVIFAVNQGRLKVLLFKNDKEPYKGYWKLPTDLLESNQDIEEKTQLILREKTGINNGVMIQSNVYYSLSTLLDEKVIHISYLVLANTVDAIYNREIIEQYESDWFDVNTLPKICYNHQKIIEDALKILKNKIMSLESIKILFPSDFTLPEIQKVYEQTLGHELDRRNFRKKIIDYLEDTKEKYAGKNGRPAKLYRFKEIEEITYN